MLCCAMLQCGYTGTAPPGRTRKHWYAAPYPSSFHYHEGIKELPWDLPGTPPPPPVTASTSAYRSSNTHPLARVLSATPPSDPASHLAPARALASILVPAVSTNSNSSRKMMMMKAAAVDDNSSKTGNNLSNYRQIHRHCYRRNTLIPPVIYTRE